MIADERGSQARVISLLGELIAFDTTSSNSNIAAADRLADFLESSGCRIERFFSADATKVNLVARKGPDCEGGLMLSGHLDVVPALEPEWSSDPFRLTEVGDRLVGRGAADMKGFVSLAACMLADADAGKLTRPLVGLFTYDEELGTVGAQDFTRQWDDRFPLPREAIVGEPTNLQVVRMHKGHTKMRIVVRGRAAHSGYPHLGSNAIEKLGAVIARLTALRTQMEAYRNECSPQFPETPHPCLNMALVAGGSAINIVPERCTLDLGIRVMPGQDSQVCIAQVRDAVKGVDGIGGDVEVLLLGDSPPFLIGEAEPLYQRLTAQVGQNETVAVSYASDAGPLATMGVRCVLFGPGSIEVAHKPNEFIPKDQLIRAMQVLGEFARDWCC